VKTLSVGEFKTHFSEALQDVKNGHPVGVSYGKKGLLVAVLVPPDTLIPRTGLNLGLLEGHASFETDESFSMSDEELLAS
jgi:antitoxin (DNA-binding transcriptional repressor) of toxin-antitoxin stability system